MSTERKWMDIDGAPRDGSPVWARGHDYGNSKWVRHYGFAYWNSDVKLWCWAGPELNIALYVTEYMPLEAP